MDDMTDKVEKLAEAVNVLNITLARIYDVLMLDLSERHGEVADRLEELHREGFFIGPPPAIAPDPFKQGQNDA